MGQGYLFVFLLGTRVGRGASKVEGTIFDGVLQDVVERLGDRCVWEVGLAEFAAPWVVVGSGFVRCLNAKEAKRKRRGFHSGEVGGEGEVLWQLGDRGRAWGRWWVAVRVRLPVEGGVGLVVGDWWE